MQPTATPAGWYADPHAPQQWRWYDGTQWTAHVSPMHAPVVAPTPTYAAAVVPPQQYGWPASTAPGGAIGADPSSAAHWLLPVGRSWQAITAGYVGLVSIVVIFLGPVAIGLGIWGISAARSGGHGRGRCVFAIITGIWGTFWTLWVIARAAGG